MKRSISAFAPGAVSCVFRPYDGQTLVTSGSLGLGFTVDLGVKVSVRRSKKTQILVGGKEWRFPTVRRVCDALADGPVEVRIHMELPVGSGFGMSGGSALGTALALNDLFSLGYSRLDLARVAHSAEIEQGTGRGDVATQLFGGVILKERRGEPFSIERLPLRSRRIHYRVFAPLGTKRILGNAKLCASIDRAGKRALARFKKGDKQLSFERIVEISREFALTSGLPLHSGVRKAIADASAKGGEASMIMLGHAAFSTVAFPGCTSLNVSRRKAEIL